MYPYLQTGGCACLYSSNETLFAGRRRCSWRWDEVAGSLRRRHLLHRPHHHHLPPHHLLLLLLPHVVCNPRDPECGTIAPASWTTNSLRLMYTAGLMDIHLLSVLDMLLHPLFFVLIIRRVYNVLCSINSHSIMTSISDVWPQKPITTKQLSYHLRRWLKQCYLWASIEW